MLAHCMQQGRKNEVSIRNKQQSICNRHFPGSGAGLGKLSLNWQPAVNLQQAFSRKWGRVEKTSFNWQPKAVNLQQAFPGNVASSLELQPIMKVVVPKQSIPKALIMNNANLLEFYVDVQSARQLNSLDCKQGNLCTIQILDDQQTNTASMVTKKGAKCSKW